MGMFHLVCPASGLGIVTEDVVLVFVAWEGKAFAPIAPPLRGTYDSYGSIEVIRVEETARRVLAGFAELKKKRQLGVSNKTNNLEGDPSVKNVKALVDDVRQGQVDETWVLAMGKNLGFVIVLASIYDAGIGAARSSADGERLAARLATADFGELLKASLGAPELARALVADTKQTRGALVSLALFRSWFDARGSWKPDPIGQQFFADELRRRVKQAKKKLAAWPGIVKAVTAYEAGIEADDEDDEDDDE